MKNFFEKNMIKIAFVSLHLCVLAVFFVQPTWTSACLCIGFYFLRMFGITAGYHRGLSHRSYESGRFVRFIMAWLGCSAMQRGPLWWAAKHRDHHKYSDTGNDPHSPVAHGVWWSHIGWVLSSYEEKKAPSTVRDLAKAWELRFLDRYHWVPGLCLAILCFTLDGWSGVVWGFVVSTVLLYHGTFLVNSVCHIFGRQRFKTGDQSRNNALVAILFTMGEGWHNNHHHRPALARQGVTWWELDFSFYILWLLSKFRLVWNLHKPPPRGRLET
jgi:stearoyl-CoA desaturase (delta-9 desaturase)